MIAANFIGSSIVIATILLVQQCNGKGKIINMYVRPDNESNTTTCPGQPCESLDYYAGLTNYSNNTSFLFIPGLHTLSKSFKIKNVMNIQLFCMRQHNDKNEIASAEIQCKVTAGLIFENVQFLSIKNLDISSCGQKIASSTYNNARNHDLILVAVAFKNVVTLTMY